MKSKNIYIASTLTSILLLVGCSNHSAPLNEYLSSSKSTTTEHVRFSDLYDEKWTEFAIICPYTGNEEIQEKLGIKSNIPFDNMNDEGGVDVVLKADNDAVEWIYFSRVDLHDLCSGDGKTLKFHPTDSILDFDYNHKYDKWELSTITEPREQES